MAETRVGPVVAAQLAARRETLNARFQATRAASPRLDAETALAFVADTVAPLVEPLPEARAGAALEALFDVALPLLGRELLGPAARLPYIQQGWERLLPRWPELLGQQPGRLARAVSNALHALGAAPGARPEDWIAAMAPLGARAASVDDLLEAGKVIAWRCGLAQYREGALAAAGRLPPELAGPALGLAVPLEQDAREALIARLRADPWADPAADADAPPALRLVAVAGAFRGFGGPFATPPGVAVAAGELVASDAQAAYILRADRFGCVFLRTATVAEGRSARPSAGAASRLSWPGSGADIRLSADGSVNWSEHSARFPELAEASSAAFDGHTLAVTHPLAHAVFLLALASAETP